MTPASHHHDDDDAGGSGLPAPCRWLLSAAAPPHDRDFVLDDMEEEFAERARTGGRLRATRWAVSQTLRSLSPLTSTRLRHRRNALAHASRGDPMLTQLRDDVRYSLRVAARRPWLSLTVVVTMVLGIGSTTAMFSIIDALLLRPLSFPAAEQLLRLWSPVRDAPGAMVANHDDIMDVQRETLAFSSLGFYSTTGFAAQVGTEPERIGAVEAGRGYGETLGIRPMFGRLFADDEFLPNGPAAVILTHAFWTSHYASDSGVVGRSLLLSGRPHTIVGVLPPIASPYPAGELSVWVPLVIPDASYLRGRYSMQLSAIARLRANATLERANAELTALARRLAAEHPATNAGRTLHATPLRDTLVGSVRPALLLLGAAVAAVLLIASANVGSLLLAHSQSRVREFAVRAAIGGESTRITRQLFVESLLLALIGGAGGVWLARLIVKGLVAVYPTRLPRASEIAIDWRVLAVALGTTVVAGVLASLPLVRQVMRLDLIRDLRSAERELGSRAHRRFLDGLVVAQIATSAALLFAAALLLRTFADMTSIKPGFDASNVLTFNIAPSQARYPTPERQAAFYDALLDSLRAIPGTEAVAWGMFTPLAGTGWGDQFAREGMADAAPNMPTMQVKMVSPDYASALRIPLLAGRSLSQTDRANAPGVAVVNAALVAAYYPGTNSVGKRITFQDRSLEIVGVIGDVRNQSLWTPPVPELYLPIDQWGWRGGTIFLRSGGDPRPIESRVRTVVRAIDPTIPVSSIATLDERVRRSMAPERFRAILVGTLAALALLLSLLGIYGLVASIVSRRTREIGIRMALGEAASRVRLHVLSHAMRLGLVGVTLGAGLALASARYLQAFVAGDVRARDPLVMLATMALFLIVTAAAAWIPARRASTVDPLLAIRAD